MFLNVGLELLEKGINNHFTTVHLNPSLILTNSWKLFGVVAIIQASLVKTLW